MAWGATCVQRLDGSRDSAIHTKYRISLRSSSMREPRYPLPRVVVDSQWTTHGRARAHRDRGRGGVPFCSGSLARLAPGFFFVVRPRRAGGPLGGPARREGGGWRPRPLAPRVVDGFAGRSAGAGLDNDPSAGSPTETLLRLLLPLNDKVQWTSHDVAGSEPPTSPRSEHFTGPFNR